MPLSDDAAELAHLKYLERAEQINEWHSKNFARHKILLFDQNKYKEAISNEHVNMARELAEVWVQLHLEAYLDEESLPDAEDLRKMGHVIEKIIRDSVPPFENILTREAVEDIKVLPIEIYTRLENRVRKLELEKKAQKRQLETVTAKVQSQSKVADETFSFVADPRIRVILERDYTELQELDSTRSPKSVLIICGGIIEGLLIDALVKSGYWTEKEASERFLKDMIHPAKNKGVIKHDNITEVLRVFRNIVHPAREIRDKLNFAVDHANHAKTSVNVMIAEVRQWHKDNPSSGT